MDYHPDTGRWVLFDGDDYVVRTDDEVLLRLPWEQRDGALLSPRLSFDGESLCASISGTAPLFTSSCLDLTGTPLVP